MRPTEGNGRLDVEIIDYESHGDVMGVVIHVRIPAGKQMTRDSRPGAPPMLQTVIETAHGWKQSPAADIGNPFPWQMQPNATNTLTLVLPNEVRRWGLVLSSREASLRERAVHRLLRAGTWARDASGTIRPILKWCIRQLPNRPGHDLRFESDIFDVGLTTPRQWRSA
jgi:hypothetical protein